MKLENAIEVRNLTKRYEGFYLDHINFQIPQGTIVGFVGENGAGKSTTIKALLGLMPIDEGEIEVLGHKVVQGEQEVSYKEQVGVVFDECNFPKELKVRDICKIMKEIYHTWEEEKFLRYLMRFEVPLEKKVKELSKGMKMKLSIAAALSHGSKLLILDEATSGLDPIVRNEILDIFREFIEDEQHTIFFSSHITSDIEKIADYVMLIHKGKLLLTENKDELLYQYGIVRCTKEQAAFIPKELIVGAEENQFETNVLVRDRQALQEGIFMERCSADRETQPVIDKASIEDLLLFLGKENEKGMGGIEEL